MHIRKVARSLATTVVSVGVVTTGVVVAVPTVASADICPAHEVGAWNDSTGTDEVDGDDGGISVWAQLEQNCFPENFYLAEFRSLGEVVRITDSYADNRVPEVLLKVEDNGTARYIGSDDHNETFDENLDVQIKLCIHGTSTCTDWSPKGKT